MDRRSFLSATAALTLIAFTAVPAVAAEQVAYSDAAFEAAKSAGRPILIDVWASWCPTCKAQHQAFKTIFEDGKYANLLVLQVDYDNQGDIVRRFKAPGQSTLIAYKGDKETGRSAGDTDPGSIKALIDSAY